ncbi:MAG: substrate-binding domain-containing protein [Anaerolineales bacterium]|nr:substrate-binding domain-containing protein [Anaerolineales bacterium]
MPVPTEVAAPGGQSSNALILATTTSTDDSGLLKYILPDFEQEFGVKVDVIAVGTGQALTLGQDGNADVLLVHARSREDEFMAAGHGVRREDVMYNDFIIIGPKSDPAEIGGMSDAAKALKKLAEAEAVFISRGDDSGTHTKELSVWKTAGIEPSGNWYISAGQGMGEVLTMATEQQAYTLSDRATYLARLKTGLDLVIVVEGDPVLFNPYGVLAVNPEKGEHIKSELANQFIDWIISLPVQEKIAQFGVTDFGQSLFIPDSPAWREAHGAVTEEAALKITGMVENEMAWTEAEVKAMEAITVQAANKDGVMSDYTGVSLNDLLALAGVSSDATTLVFVADDGYTAEVSIAEVQACTDCILSFRSQGGFSTVLPGFSSKLQVKGVVEIQVK